MTDTPSPAGKTLQVKIAKPTDRSFYDCIWFWNAIQSFATEGTLPVLEETPKGYDCIDEKVVDQEEFMEWLREKVEGRNSVRMEHVLWAGKTAIDNAFDPEAETIEFRKDLAMVPGLVDLLRRVSKSWLVDDRLLVEEIDEALKEYDAVAPKELEEEE